MGRVLSKVRSANVRWLIATACIACVAVRAHAQQNPQQTVEDMNREAMESYTALDINKAGSTLEQALRIASQGGVPPQLYARTALNLGIVYIGGLNDQQNGLNYFTQALCIDPSVQLDPLMSSPDIQNVFGVATQRARGGACPGAPPSPRAGDDGPTDGSADGSGRSPAAAAATAATAARSGIHAHAAGGATRADAAADLRRDQSARAGALDHALLQRPRHGAVQSRADVSLPERLCLPDQLQRRLGTQGLVLHRGQGRDRRHRRRRGQRRAAGRSANRLRPQAGRARAAGSDSRRRHARPRSARPACKGCKAKGKSGIAEACDGDSDCQSGLECSSGKCVLIGAGGTEVPAYNPVTGGYETTGGEAATAAGAEFPKNFVQLGLAAGLAYVQAGMIADHGPPRKPHLPRLDR